MSQKTDDVPFMQSYIYKKIKEKTHGNIVRTRALKEIIRRNIICHDGRGGLRRGFPKTFIFEIIKDLTNLGLLERLDHTKYKILNNKKIKRVNNFVI